MSDRLTINGKSLTSLEDAIRWCAQHELDVSFRGGDARSEVLIRQGNRAKTQQPSFMEAVRTMRQQMTVPEPYVAGTAADKDLQALEYESRNCRGRIRRIMQAIGAQTIGDLLTWAARQPRGLRQVRAYSNIGARTLDVLVAALRREGIDEIPGID